MLAALPGRPLAWLSLLVALGGLMTVVVVIRDGGRLKAFLGSCAFLAGMLAATAACVFPVMLRAIRRRSAVADGVQRERIERRPADSARLVDRRVPARRPLFRRDLFGIHRGKVLGATGRDGY